MGDGEESVQGMDRLALDDETSSMDSRVPDGKKKGKVQLKVREANLRLVSET